MKTFIRSALAFVALTVASTLIAGTIDLTVTSGKTVGFSLSTSTGYDGEIQIVNAATNQVVATGYLFAQGGSHTAYMSAHIAGVSFGSGSGYHAVYGLPAGTYRITTSAYGATNVWSWSSGTYGEIYDTVNWSIDMFWYFDTH